MKSFVVCVGLTLLLAGCGGGTDASGPSTATTGATTVTDAEPAGPPSLGCDYLPHCYAEWAEEALARCPADTLDAAGRELRTRLQRQLARIEDVDLHNEQAYEAFEAVGAALEAFGEHCP
jgi:hypothetical protein